MNEYRKCRGRLDPMGRYRSIPSSIGGIPETTTVCLHLRNEVDHSYCNYTSAHCPQKAASHTLPLMFLFSAPSHLPALISAVKCQVMLEEKKFQLHV